MRPTRTASDFALSLLPLLAVLLLGLIVALAFPIRDAHADTEGDPAALESVTESPLPHGPSNAADAPALDAAIDEPITDGSPAADGRSGTEPAIDDPLGTAQSNADSSTGLQPAANAPTALPNTGSGGLAAVPVGGGLVLWRFAAPIALLLFFVAIRRNRVP